MTGERHQVSNLVLFEQGVYSPANNILCLFSHPTCTIVLKLNFYYYLGPGYPWTQMKPLVSFIFCVVLF